MENGRTLRKEVAGIILAAGYSSRMGAFKPLLPIGDVTAIEKVSASLKSAGIKQIFGVTGFQRERLKPVFAGAGIEEAYNPDFDQGMFSSVKAGIAKAMEEHAPDGFLIMLADCPLIPPEVLMRILETHQEYPDAFILPCYRGKNGHPLLIPSLYAEEILSFEGAGGLKAIRNRHEDKLIRIDVDQEAVVLDMDTREGYEEVLAYHRKDEEPVEDRLKGRRLFLVRHGEIRQHREKIFLGQTDIPLSDKGRTQAAKAAEDLKNHGISVKRIYTSDLSRAAETAEIIGKQLAGGAQEIHVVPVPALREMSLGSWDGQYIREIRERYPEEYRKRGENLLSYKFGNDSENFYDLQYRVMKGFFDILKQEAAAADSGKTAADSRDILIVAHQGVIRVVLSSLRHTDLKEEMNNGIPNGGIAIFIVD